MAYTVSRSVVDAFYRAYTSRDPQQIGAMLDDDVEWYVAGPTEVMQVCGTWRGKAAVIERFSTFIPNIIQFKNLQIETLLADGDSSAMFGRISCVHRPTGRQISHRVAHLVRYRDDKVVSYRVMNDSLDAAEQYVGHHIALTDDAPPVSDDLVVI
jgi:ketosteroid isomerase-like protein